MVSGQWHVLANLHYFWTEWHSRDIRFSQFLLVQFVSLKMSLRFCLKSLLNKPFQMKSIFNLPVPFTLQYLCPLPNWSTNCWIDNWLYFPLTIQNPGKAGHEIQSSTLELINGLVSLVHQHAVFSDVAQEAMEVVYQPISMLLPKIWYDTNKKK